MVPSPSGIVKGGVAETSVEVSTREAAPSG